MKRLPSITAMAVAALCLPGLSPQAAAQYDERVCQYVNPLIGTGAANADSYLGSTCPGAALPFGMVQLSPDTRNRPSGLESSGYVYADDSIYGFSHTHLSGAGMVDLLDVLVMPSDRPADELTREATFALPFSHADEQASPGYYRVDFRRPAITAEMTATLHTGIHRYTWQEPGGERTLVVDLHHQGDFRWLGTPEAVVDAQMRLVSPTVLTGFRVARGWQKMRRVYFYCELSKPVSKSAFTSSGEVFAAHARGTDVKAILSFDDDGEPLVVKVGISPVSIDNARQNLRMEAGGDFDSACRKAGDAWEDAFQNIRIDATPQQKTVFYTALYHAYLQPNLMSDVNRQYMRADYTTGTLREGEEQYGTFSLWDTFRAVNPLYILLQPAKVPHLVNTMLRHFDDCGYLPIWQLWGTDNHCMTGNHAVPVLADAVIKGVRGIDSKRVYQAVKTTLTTDHHDSPFSLVERYGYLPMDLQPQSVAIAQEMAYDDASAARLADAMGLGDDRDYFLRRSLLYRNLYDPAAGFFRGKDSRGRWAEPFDALAYGANGDSPYTEGNAWQYLWNAPHDTQGLIAMMGGRKAFVEKLDSFFTITRPEAAKNGNASGFIGQYAHGNEPSHHCAYLYSLAGKPRLTAKYVDKVCREMYSDTPGGYAGNEDCGQMSAWYVFSSMGFYPLDPTSGRYVFGSPQLRSVRISLPEGRTLTIVNHRKSDADYAVTAVRLNGEPLRDGYITHQQIMEGGTLEFSMGR